MADPRSPTGDPLPLSQLPPLATSAVTEGTANLDTSEQDSAAAGEDNATNERTSFGAPAPPVEQRAPPGPDMGVLKQVGEVLASEVGVPTLLARLKQSIASTKEFALFLKKRSQMEEDHCQSLKKLSRSSQENAHKAEHRQGTFSFAYDEMMRIHDRMAENGIQFASSLVQMHEDLIEHANMAERQRKTWKTNGLAAEQRVVDLETAMRKAKTKYDSLAEDYDRARTGDNRQGGKVFGLKGPKSAAQHEEDLLRKVQAADQNYAGHVQTLQAEKSSLESATRPEAIRALQDMIKETDSGLALQMQKFATFNEKLLLANGLIVSPTQTGDAAAYRSMRMAIASINNEKDFNDYVATHRGEVQPKVEIIYERNPVLNPQTSSLTGYSQRPPSMGGPPPAFGQPQGGPELRGNQGPPGQFQNPQSFTMGARTDTSNFSPSSPQAPHGGPQGPPGGPLSSSPFAQQPHNRSFSQGYPGPPGGQPGGPPGHLQNPQSPQYGRGAGPGQPFNGGQPPGPPQLGNLGFQQQNPQQQPYPGPSSPQGQVPDLRSGNGPVPAMGGGKGGPPQGFGAPTSPVAPPTKPVFGVSLHALYERDGQAVPMVVQQCMQAVNLFGLTVEGIYRQSGSMNHIQKLKHMFDMDSESPELDFRNPENFYHDVNSVTGLLKLFFRDLPDPLLTHEHHADFIKAAKHDDDTFRRDSLHAIINSLPDPNYATLRAIALHLHRITDNSQTNRMNSHNLAVIFGPTLMGTDPSTAIADAGWQIKVVDTILQNCYQIFDED